MVIAESIDWRNCNKASNVPQCPPRWRVHKKLTLCFLVGWCVEKKGPVAGELIRLYVCDLRLIETEQAGLNECPMLFLTSFIFLFCLFFLCFIHICSFTSFSYFLECNCSGLADECVFDAEQYRSTGSGGRCVGCRENTAGPHCERCRENFFRSFPQQPCHDCNCNAMGELRAHTLDNKAVVYQSHSCTLSLVSYINPCIRT